MRLAIAMALVGSALGCSSDLKRTLDAGAPQGYIEAYARDEGISVEEARKNLAEMRRSPGTINPAIEQVQQQQRGHGIVSPRPTTLR